MSARMSVTVRRLTASDADRYRTLRLEALGSAPDAFGTSAEEEDGKPATWWTDRLERNAVFGGVDDGPLLLGIAGLFVPDAAKLRHKGTLWGMYVRPEARRSGVARALLARVIEHAAGRVEEVQLTVVTTNTAAIRLYTRAGFTPYGREERALKIAGRYHDEILMSLRLQADAADRRSGSRQWRGRARASTSTSCATKPVPD